MSEHDYVLGTHDEEIARLGLQHRVWRSRTLECWAAAGFTTGMDVLDVGAGPGFATIDLAEIVGPTGTVTAFERSERFMATGQARAVANGLKHVEYINGDLMLDEIPDRQFDRAWVRWVLCFLTDPALALRKVHKVLKPGGLFAIHEYVNYCTWRAIPDRPAIDEYIDIVMASWRATGGEPDIAKDLPVMLRAEGFNIVSLKPIVFVMRPSDYSWGWPKAFIGNQTDRLLEDGKLTPELAARVKSDMAEMTNDPNSLMVSPMVLEIIAEKI